MRIEEDMLGEKSIPDKYYYGIHTKRALENFPISHYKLSDFPELIQALIYIKKAAAYANFKVGLLSKRIHRAIEDACDRIINDELWDQFPVDMLQGGGGTSTNMNVNEVIANIAGELLGGKKGAYKKVHPIQHVNLSQSTNDVYPSAIRATLFSKTKELAYVLKNLANILENKEKEFSSIIKLGRTCLQDAVPITLGQEFSGYKCLILRTTSDLEKELPHIRVLNIGGTAVGTGIGCKKNFTKYALEYLNNITKEKFQIADNLFDATQNCDVLLSLSGRLKNIALSLSKIGNDLRLLSSGPETGLLEIIIPPVQAGSSIMPGKVNPVIPEVINQIAYKVCGNDLAVSMALERGELELNIMEPVMILCLLESIEILKNGIKVFGEKCIKYLKANEKVCRKYANSSIAVYTMLSEKLGYNQINKLIKESKDKGIDIKDLILKKKILTRYELEDCLKINLISTEKTL